MARQFDAAQADLKWAQGAIERYFNRGAKRTQVAAEMLRQVAQQAKRRRRRAARRDARRAGDRRRAALERRRRHARHDLVRPAVRRGRGAPRRPSAPTTAWRRSTGAAGGSTSRSTCSCWC
jgi:hypothetical protein